MTPKNVRTIVAGMLCSAGILASTWSTNAIAQDTQVTSTALGHGVHMVVGKGGNVGVLTGPDGTFMIDDQYAPLTEKIMSVVKALGGDSPRFVVNTHFHGDHTGGNENLGNAGAMFVSHDNVRARLLTGAEIKAFAMKMPPAAPAALPVITFSHEATFHINGETVRVFHAPRAHTDGDGIVHFKKANVIHAGDTFFNGFYPFIDTGNGGTVRGVIAAADAMLALSNAQTQIIPGHGPLGSRDDLHAYRAMLSTVLDRLSKLKASGMTAEQISATNPLKDLEAQWGKGIFSGNKWVSIIYGGL
jgi:cyclase